ncbi:MAG: hypothetical protein LBC78_01675 [Oscillospiraceae bacterium]|jgi:hypothetical protein|nr:hypothetical protein [Oscillospiraceae bacterium]
MFAPPGTAVPAGFGRVDFGALELGVCWIQGREPDIYLQDDAVINALYARGLKPAADKDGALWMFERYNCPRFTVPDADGNIVLDLCYVIG